MERQRRFVTKRVGTWGSFYVIGGAEGDGETLSPEQANDLIARFDHDQALFARTITSSSLATSIYTRKPSADFQHDAL
jgi:hypothetical protein